MEIIYGDASNINLTAQKRLLRVVQGQTQATPTSGYLDPSLRNTTGGIRVPLNTDKEGVVPTGGAAAAPFTRDEAAGTGANGGSAFTFEGSLTPGLCLVKTVGENYAIAGKASTGEVVAGLLGQWVGGTFDGVKNTNNISVWQGPDSVYDLLAPGFNAEGLAAEMAENKKGTPVYLYAGTDARLGGIGGGTDAEAATTKPVAEVIEYNPSVLRFKLLV